MELDIINHSKVIHLYGVSKLHNKQVSYSTEIMELLDQVWAEVKANKLAHKGINHVVYDCDDILFAGVELETPDVSPTSLIQRTFNFTKYAYWKHIGPYSQLGDTHRDIRAILQGMGQHDTCPAVEIYGHWDEDPSKLETEIIYSVK